MIGAVDTQGDVSVNRCHDCLLHLRYSVASVFWRWRLGAALARLQVRRTLCCLTQIHILTCHGGAAHAGLAVFDQRFEPHQVVVQLALRVGTEQFRHHMAERPGRWVVGEADGDTGTIVGDGSKRMLPAFATVAPGSLCQASTLFGSERVITASHATGTPAGPSATQCERPLPRSRTSRRCAIKRGKLATLRKQRKTSSTGASIVMVFWTSTARRPAPRPSNRSNSIFVAPRASNPRPSAPSSPPSASPRRTP